MSATINEATEKQQVKEGRDANGRFTPGNPGGPGNPYARKVAELRKAMVEFVSLEELKHIVFAIKMKAESGNIAAAKLLFQYVLGKPLPSDDPDRISVDEWIKMKEQARPMTELTDVMNSIPAQKASDLSKITWPCAFQTNFAEPLREMFKAADERDAQAAGVNPAARQPGAPMANGENGGAGNWGVMPIPNVGIGKEEDWLLQLAREIQPDQPLPNGKNGKAARRKPKRRQRA